MKKHVVVAFSIMLGISLMLMNTACRQERVKFEEAQAIWEQQVMAINAYIDGMSKAGTAQEMVEKIDNFANEIEEMIPRINQLLVKFSADQAKAGKSENETMAKLMAVVRFTENLGKMNIKKYGTDPDVLKAREKLSFTFTNIKDENLSIEEESIKSEYSNLVEGKITGGEQLEKLSAKLGNASLSSKMKITMAILLSTGRGIQSFINDYEYAPDVKKLDELNYYKNFVPLYMKQLSTKDAWGNDLYYKADGDNFWLGSAGSDGKFEGFDQQGHYSDLAGRDIILTGKEFVYGPKIVQK